jgi:hypothetical protein
MTTQLAAHFKDRRLEKGISVGQLAKLAGYHNISKGSKRIHTFERCGEIDEILLVKLSVALDVDHATTNELVERDRAEHLRKWERWVNEPVPMTLIARLMSAIYSVQQMPSEIETPEQAERYARRIAAERHQRMCLVVSRRLSVWIGMDGEVEMRKEADPFEESCLPYMRVGSKRFLLQCTPSPPQE